MSKLAEDRSENAFPEYKEAYTAQQARLEANRCLYCGDAPCIQACPTAINIPEFIRKIATDNLRGAARTIFSANILGMSCARVCPVEVLCVGDCVLNRMGMPPIEIGRLQRFATDAAFKAGWREFQAGPESGYSVGLVGAGPAALAAAHELRRLGHACTIYEQQDLLGGLNTAGVAPYKMKADRALEEAEWILAIGGIQVQTAVRIPQDLSWEKLAKRHAALMIAIGKGPGRLLDLPGADLAGVMGALPFIKKVKCGRVDLAGAEQAIVIGGGNTALDGVRELLGLGVAKVTLLYRGSETTMKGYQHEWAAARQAGALALWQHIPLAFLGRGGKVAGVQCALVDRNRRRLAGSLREIPADLVLIAAGQTGPADALAGLADVAVEEGRIRVDAEGATTRPGIFAAGDCANGGREVVNAAAEGKRAALAIHAYLKKESSHA